MRGEYAQIGWAPQYNNNANIRPTQKACTARKIRSLIKMKYNGLLVCGVCQQHTHRHTKERTTFRATERKRGGVEQSGDIIFR